MLCEMVTLCDWLSDANKVTIDLWSCSLSTFVKSVFIAKRPRPLESVLQMSIIIETERHMHVRLIGCHDVVDAKYI